MVVPGTREIECEERCAELDTEVEGARLTLHWDLLAPEEDPGGVAVALQREDEYAYVVQAGPDITRDPRELDLEVSVEDMVTLVEDPWLQLRTSPEAVEAGEEVEDWEGGEPEAYEPVPNTDLGMLAAYEGFGFGGRFTGHRPSPLKGELGPGAIGGRMTRLADGRQQPVVLDVLAAPDPDAWLGDDPCSRWRGGCVEQLGGRGQVYLAWRPAVTGDPGVVWAVLIREDEVIAIRMSGPRVPSSREKVMADVEWQRLADFLGEDDKVGMETVRQVVDRGEELSSR